MVYHGLSRGCATCRKRRIKCDETKPQCLACIKRKQPCPGYRDIFDLMHKDQTLSVPEKARRKHAASDKKKTSEQNHEGDKGGSSHSDASLVVTKTLSEDTEMASLCFFFTHYVAVANNPSISHGFLEHMIPAYSQVLPSSPLSLATSAVAVTLASIWTQRDSGTRLARSIFANALSSIKAIISDPAQVTSDETLLTVLLLEFYESVSSNFNSNKNSSAVHQSGAVALVKHRGISNFNNEISKRLLVAVRSQIVSHALQKKEKIVFDPEIWEDQAEMPKDPAIELDSFGADLANLRAIDTELAASKGGRQALRPDSTSAPRTMEANTVLTMALDLDSRLSVWPETIPHEWHYISVSSPQHVHPSIVAAGMYGQSCDVYASLHVAVTYNLWRCIRLGALIVILKHCYLLGPDLNGGCAATRQYARQQIQKLVDEICDSVPFYLGNRTQPTPVEETDGVEYPRMPVVDVNSSPYIPELLYHALNLARQNHARLAAASGGQFLLSILSAMLQTVQEHMGDANDPQLLRNGQLNWIMQQQDRLRAIYPISRQTAA